MEKHLEKTVEKIFSVAVALSQGNVFRNKIITNNNYVFIRNFDETVWLEYKFLKGIFPSTCFDAVFYEGGLEVKNNFIIFNKITKNYEKKKYIKNEFLEEDFNNFFSKFNELKNKYNKKNKIKLDKELINLLDENLNHTEFMIKQKTLHLIQKDLYNGNIVDIFKKENFIYDFSEITSKHWAIRTFDLKALFTWEDELNFYFDDSQEYLLVQNDFHLHYEFSGLIGNCIYDELNTLNII